MGGRKKPTISQLEKKMRKTERAKGKKEKKFEMKLDSMGELTKYSVEQIVGEIKGMPYITPYLIATKFGIKISRAKAVLRQLESRKLVKAIDKNRRSPIYVAAG